MTSLVRATTLAALFVVAATGTALADGWIDCNGPDKSGRGCSTSGRDTASTGSALALAGLVAFGIRRRRTRSTTIRQGDPRGDDRDLP